MTLPPGWLGLWRFCCWIVAVVLRELLPVRAGWLLLRVWLLPERVWACGWAAGAALRFTWLLVEGAALLRFAALLELELELELLRETELLELLRVLLPLRLTEPLGEDIVALRFCVEDWVLRLTEPSPLVLPDWAELRVCEEGEETDELDLLALLLELRVLPLPDPLRELLPLRVWAFSGTATRAAAARAVRMCVVKRFIIMCFTKYDIFWKGS